MAKSALLASVPFLVVLIGGCSGGADAPATSSDAGLDSDGRAPDASSSETGSAQEAGADAGAVGPCAFGLSGGRTVPQTNSVDGCGHDVVSQQKGQGEFTLTLGGGFAIAGGSVTVACTLSSATAPVAGAKWTLTTGSGGNCEVDETKGGSAAIWSASTQSADGTATVTFVSATLKPSTLNPTNVYYTYEATLEATMKERTAGGTTVTVNGGFKNGTLPLGF